jgi:hypothetical protein
MVARVIMVGKPRFASVVRVLHFYGAGVFVLRFDMSDSL